MRFFKKLRHYLGLPVTAVCIVMPAVYLISSYTNAGAVSLFNIMFPVMALAFILSRTVGLSAVWYAFPISELGSITFVGINLYRIYQNKIKPMGD